MTLSPDQLTGAGVLSLQVFGPSSSPGGERLAVNVSREGLHFDLGGARIAVSWINIVFGKGGFDGRQLMLSWQSSGFRWSAMLADDAQLATLIGYAPPAQAQQLGRWQREVRGSERRFRIGIGVTGLLLAMPIVGLIIFLLQGARIAEWVSDNVSIETEQRLGALLFEQTRQQFKMVDDPVSTGFLAEIGTRLTQGSVYTYHWYVVRDDAINAFAIPAGYIVVNTGLLMAADSAEEVAGVLAHEVQHVELRHSLRGLVHSLGWMTLVTAALGSIDVNAIASVAHKLGTLQFSREQESQADVAALAALNRAAINPAGMLTFFKKLASNESVSIELLSTHPASDSRMHVLANLIEKSDQKKYDSLNYNWKEFREKLAEGISAAP